MQRREHLTAPGEDATHKPKREASEKTESADSVSRIWGLQKGVSVILTFYSVYFAMTTLETEEAHILVSIQ